jgi:hypothetical protein
LEHRTVGLSRQLRSSPPSVNGFHPSWATICRRISPEAGLKTAPFDVIILAAAPDHIPPALVEQLAPSGRLVLPVGRHMQDLTVVEKKPDGTTEEWTAVPVAFVPMTGEAEEAAR